jgi:hypothetical protein
LHGIGNVQEDDYYYGNDNMGLNQEELSAAVVAIEFNSRVRWDARQN